MRVFLRWLWPKSKARCRFCAHNNSLLSAVGNIAGLLIYHNQPHSVRVDKIISVNRIYIG